jgi:hypothetical protein
MRESQIVQHDSWPLLNDVAIGWIIPAVLRCCLKGTAVPSVDALRAEKSVVGKCRFNPTQRFPPVVTFQWPRVSSKRTCTRSRAQHGS